MSHSRKGKKILSSEDDDEKVLGYRDILDADDDLNNSRDNTTHVPSKSVNRSSEGAQDEKLFVPSGHKKQFKLSSASDYHAKTPSKLCRYFCKYCGKLFNKNCDLARHKRIHTGERPYKCDVCSMTFSRKDVMLLHVRKQHVVDTNGGVEYTCLKCQACFMDKGDLENHVSKHEGEEEAEAGMKDDLGTKMSGEEKMETGHSTSTDSKTSTCSSSLSVISPNAEQSAPEPQCMASPSCRSSSPTLVSPGGVKEHLGPTVSSRSDVSEDAKFPMSSHRKMYKCKKCQKHFRKYCTLRCHEQTAHIEIDAVSSKSPCLESVQNTSEEHSRPRSADSPEYLEHSSFHGRRNEPQEKENNTLFDRTTAENVNAVLNGSAEPPLPSVSSHNIDWYAHSPSIAVPQREQHLYHSTPLPCDCSFCHSNYVQATVNQHLCSPRTPDLCSPRTPDLCSPRTPDLSRLVGPSYSCKLGSRSLSYVGTTLAQIYESNGCGITPHSQIINPLTTSERFCRPRTGTADSCLTCRTCQNGHFRCSNDVCFYGVLPANPEHGVIPPPASPVCRNVMAGRSVHGQVVLGWEAMPFNGGCGCLSLVPMKQEVIDDPDVFSVLPGGIRVNRNMCSEGTASIKEELTVPRMNKPWHQAPDNNLWITHNHQSRETTVNPYLGHGLKTTVKQSEEVGNVFNHSPTVGTQSSCGTICMPKPKKNDQDVHNCHTSPVVHSRDNQVILNTPSSSSPRKSAFSPYHGNKHSTAGKTFSPETKSLLSNPKTRPAVSVQGVQPLGKLFSSSDEVSFSPQNNTSPRYELSHEEMDEFVASSITTLLKENNQKVYQCNICKKSLSQKGDLKRHLKIHLGQKDFICLFCSRGFIKNSDLQRHIRTRHTREKPYECSQCLRKYARTDQLLDHVRMHLGDKRFECELCHEKFLRRYELQKHVREHFQSKKQCNSEIKTEPEAAVEPESELEIVKIEMDISSDDNVTVDLEAEDVNVTMVNLDKESEHGICSESINESFENESKDFVSEMCDKQLNPHLNDSCGPLNAVVESNTLGKNFNIVERDPTTRSSPVCPDVVFHYREHFEASSKTSSSRSCSIPQKDYSLFCSSATSVVTSPTVRSDNVCLQYPTVKTINPSVTCINAKSGNLSLPYPTVKTNDLIVKCTNSKTGNISPPNPPVKTNDLLEVCAYTKSDNRTLYPFVKTNDLVVKCTNSVTDNISPSYPTVKTDDLVVKCINSKSDNIRPPYLTLKTNDLNVTCNKTKSGNPDLPYPTVKTNYLVAKCTNTKSDNSPPYPTEKTTDNVRSDNNISQSCPTVNTETESIKHENINRINQDGNGIQCPKSSTTKRAQRSKSGQNICQICIRVFSQRGDLKRHMKIHTGERDFVCDFCPKAFIKRSDLKRHLLVHTQEKPFSCELCQMKFSRKDQLQTHVSKRCSKKTILHLELKSSSKTPCADTSISLIVPKKSTKDVHLIQQKGKQKSSVSTPCHKTISREKIVFEEGKGSHYLNGTTELCENDKQIQPSVKQSGEDNGNTKLESIFLDDHQKGNTSDTNSYSALVQANDNNEFASSKPSSKRQHGDRNCSKSEISTTSNHQDKSKEMNSHMFPCKYCEKRFLTRSKLQIHYMTHNSESEHKVAKYECSQCDLSFSGKDLWDTHTVVVHRVLKPYVCGYCSKTFMKGGELEDHISEHRSVLALSS